MGRGREEALSPPTQTLTLVLVRMKVGLADFIHGWDAFLVALNKHQRLHDLGAKTCAEITECNPGSTEGPLSVGLSGLLRVRSTSRAIDLWEPLLHPAPVQQGVPFALVVHSHTLVQRRLLKVLLCLLPKVACVLF